MRYNQRVENNPYNSNTVKRMAKTKLENAQKLAQLYLRLGEEIFDVLETYAYAHKEDYKGSFIVKYGITSYYENGLLECRKRVSSRHSPNQ